MLKKPKIDILSILGEAAAIIDGHFELPSGLHIQSYVDTSVVMQYPSMAAKIAKALVALFDKKADVIFAASAENSIIAQEVARACGARSIFAIEEAGVLKLKGGMTMRPGEKVLIVDNVTMTGRKVKEAAGMVKLYGATPLGIAVIADRSDCGSVADIPLRSLLSYPLETFKPQNCPLCKAKIKLTKMGGKK
ncbi:MAG: hypothetical protein LBR90_00700 [Elusimicrobiota bacterium]|jgi:orotate phosphoribosyltransferase|nr:hypothetical protein [Elusimicrobiota bacterium]